MLCTSSLVLIIIGISSAFIVQAGQLSSARKKIEIYDRVDIINYLLINKNSNFDINKKIELYESAIKNLPVGLYLKDMKGNIIISNEQMVKMTGNEGSPKQFKHVADIFSSDHIHTMEEGDNAIVATGNPLTFLKSFFKGKLF